MFRIRIRSGRIRIIGPDPDGTHCTVVITSTLLSIKPFQSITIDRVKLKSLSADEVQPFLYLTSSEHDS